MKQEQPSALDGLIRLYIWPCFHRCTKCFTSRSTNAGRQIRGCVLLSVFSSKPSMQMRCCRVEYGSNGNRHEKSRLLLPSVETLRFKPRARAWVNGFNFVAFHGNDLIISTFFVCLQVFFNCKLCCKCETGLRHSNKSCKTQFYRQLCKCCMCKKPTPLMPQ